MQLNILKQYETFTFRSMPPIVHSLSDNLDTGATRKPSKQTSNLFYIRVSTVAISAKIARGKDSNWERLVRALKCFANEAGP